MVLYIVLVFLAVIAINKFTVINLSPKLLFRGSWYKQFPELQDSLQGDKFSMYRVAQTRNVAIQYFPEKNFFLIGNFKRLGYFNPIKIDSAGKQVFELNMEENDPFKFLEMINCFVVGANGIYDLSADAPVAVPFAEVLNRDKNIGPEKWVEMFEQLYRSSDVVLYGWYNDMETAQSVYFRSGGKWTKLYAYKFIYADGTRISCKVNGKIIPQKWHEVHYLKDVENATYSNEYRYKDNYITPFNSDGSFFPDQQLEYPAAGELKTLAFSKESYTTEGYFNPGIPNTFYGTGYYALHIDSSILHFKTIAYKHNGIGEAIQTDLHLFGLPLAFAKRSQVRFLTYDYGTNFKENGKKGVYVLACVVADFFN
jgi:hypothetical protein